ncbi:hypothetical protein O6H91_04G109700 [Diphasiastrum complanatum]|uniref:Uncharacterized protein n=1 Tax=Diphasiastrum complanatum TaxID=34168 RepID=A0ACC2E144_DIPCM|nr:hypothetical protein O6H91_04G109700 [Diphasiastrum complanatum]
MQPLIKARGLRRPDGVLKQQTSLIPCTFLVLVLCFLLVASIFSASVRCPSKDADALQVRTHPVWARLPSNLQEFDCVNSPQAAPVFAHRVEGVKYPFFISIADLGSPDKPNRNFQRMIKGKLFQKPAISETVQKVLEKLKAHTFRGESLLVVDVGANVGMAAFAAAAMDVRVIAFEPVLENVLRVCDGLYLNRASQLVKVYHTAVSDVPGNITLHKVMGRLDNSAVSASGAKLAFQSNKVIPFTVSTVTLDSVIPDNLAVSLLKVDVQGWELHVLKGATKLLSRPAARAPYLIYEENERLLQESNSTSQQILSFLHIVGYSFCKNIGGDRHCSKEPDILRSL